jgi:CubicO group peptidase (beta-lactamase class C family)
MVWNPILKITLIVLVALTALFLLTLAVWAAVAGPVTVARILRYGDTDIDDFSHYPGRQLEASSSPFHFIQAANELDPPASASLAFGTEGDLEHFLETNDTIAFLIIQGDTLLYERYFQGHTPASISQGFSMSKSFTSALVGMAIQDGYFTGTDQAITDHVPELAEAGFDGVSLHHLLTMTSGSNYVENDNPFGEHVILNYTPQLVDRILEFRMEQPPGELFRYKSGDNALLALALDRALGEETLTAYTQRRLWEPLGMEHGAVWSTDQAGEDGLEKTWCCLAAAARDFAKFGRLYLNQGVWDGRQLLPPDWTARSVRGHIPAALWPEDYKTIGWWNYGYQWWLASEGRGDYFALGKDIQVLYLHPAKDLIILRLGWNGGNLLASEWITLFQGIADGVE